ncbi:MAG: translation initiation factor IF-2 [Ignavibacteriae bacterium]|nr:translation initiation factor IF-2 [Ignavibacteria bacterium]MBI3363687.1 translation initiation factor IF-2 [Ignavibacteriota bacterium]
MTEKSHPHKKIYQLAKEINISHETLMEYLKKKGHNVKSHMSVVTDEMMHDIMSHFKKEKEVAEKHQRKIQTIREARKKVDTKVSATAGGDEGRLKVAAKKSKGEETSATPVVTSKTPVIEKRSLINEAPDIEPVSVEHELATQELREVEQIEAEPEEQSTSADVIDVPIVSDTSPPGEAGEKPPIPEKKPKADFLARRSNKMGLKIKGKIDLEELNRTNALHEGTAPADGDQTETTEEAAKKKKKKKKRIRTEAPTTTAPRTEDTDDLARKAKKKKKLRFQEVDQQEVDEAIKRTLAEMDDSSVATRATFKRKRKEKRMMEEQQKLQEQEKEQSILRVTEFVSVHELANLMSVNVADVIKKCIELGMMVSINQRLDKDTITLVADEYGLEVRFVSELEEEDVEEEAEDESTLESRPPVVTIMGHVDHGKTSLLDYIRRSNVVAGEAGGITQHIGAYQVAINDTKYITFLDTPGHEAFTAMRARGAQLTDIVILVVAADDSVMPQTVEAISHAQAANVPIIIAINKVDKPEANPDRIRQQLAERNILVEEWGGKYQCVEISARNGKNIDTLLEKIVLESELLDMRANPNTPARGTVIEARVDKGKGTVATILVQKGMLKIGDAFVAGTQSGKVRAMYDERSRRVEVAKSSTPVQILGFDGVPQAGDTFVVVDNDREAREISLRRTQLKREQDFRLIRSVSLDELSKRIQEGQVKELKVIVKGDVDGSVGALADSLMKIQHEEVRVNVIHRAVGSITESDVLLATASGAVIIGFHVRPNLNARRLSEQESVDIRFYNIIYDAIEDVKKALEGLLAPEQREEITATVEVRETFKVPKIGTVAGCYVQDGAISRGNKVRLVRDGIVIFEGGLTSLRRFKDDVREVEAGFECGIGLEGFNDIKVGDSIEAFKIIETMRKLV